MYTKRYADFTIINKEGKVLCQLRDSRAPTDPNRWSFFGGGIEKDENPKQAVRREAKEELGLNVKEPKFFRRYEFKEPHGLIEVFFFLAKADPKVEHLKSKQKEGKDLGFFGPGDVDSLDMRKNMKIVLRDVLEMKEPFGYLEVEKS